MNQNEALFLAFFAGPVIFLTVISINYIGDGLRDAIDPRKIRWELVKRVYYLPGLVK